METFTVSFFGHRELDNSVEAEKRLESFLRDLLVQHDYVEFLVGRSGDFDLLVSSVIRRLKKSYRGDNSSLVCVLPRMTAEFQNNEDSFLSYYDEVELCQEAAAAHFKAAITVRNRCMVGRSSLVVFWITRESGGAYQTMRYAEKEGIPAVNLASAAIPRISR